MTLDMVVVDIGTAKKNDGLIFTALGFVRDINNLVLEGFDVFSLENIDASTIF